MKMVLEEMSELQKEICKRWRGKDNRDAIIEEVADLEIMLDQLKLMLDIQYHVQQARQDKLLRLRGDWRKQEMSQETKGNIRRVPKGCEGIPEDGVEMMAKCTITNFTVKKRKVTGIGSQTLANCKMMASFDTGVVSVSVRGQRPFMVSVRLDEMMALLKEAADYSMEVKPRKLGEKEKEEEGINE